MSDGKSSKCEEGLMQVLASSSRARFLLEQIEAAGCALPANFFVCRHCDGDISGGFAMNDAAVGHPQVVMCENKPMALPVFQNTVIHELVHAYDACRAKIDPTNCTQHACTEVRASALSGECTFFEETRRGRLQIAYGHRDCVERRATLSVAMNPSCQSAGVAEEAVKKAMAKCYRDTAPFDKDT